MTPWRICRKIDLTQWQRAPEALGLLAYTGNAKGHRIELSMQNEGQEQLLDGYSVRAYFLIGKEAAPESMIPVQGTIAGNLVTVDFPQQAYAKEGRSSVVVCAEKSGEQIPLYSAIYSVRNGSSEVIIDPSDIVPSLAELLAQIDAMKDATERCTQTETNVRKAENAREVSESARAQAENARATAEQNRAYSEQQRASAESARLKNESARAEAEQKRVSAETGRTNSESARASAETARTTAEQNRATAERARVTAEGSRATAESERVKAENSRATAESKRVTEHAENQKESKAQTERAKAAADKLSEFEVSVTSLPPSANPTADVTQTDTKTKVALGIPTSNFAYATFYIDAETRQLIMRVPNGFDAIRFEIKDRRLVVRING